MVATRSSTGKAPQKRYFEEAGSEDENDESYGYASRPNKRARKESKESEWTESDYSDSGSRRTKGMRKEAKISARLMSRTLYKGRHVGKLSLLLTMPLDIFMEVARHLAPLDLLYIARTSRDLRKLLMSKTSRQMWRESQKSLGMPNCPNDLHEPQYASLVFERFCHGCDTPGVERVVFALRVRLCRPCFKTTVIRGSSIAYQEFKGKLSDDLDIFSLLPFYESERFIYRLKQRRYYKPHFLKLITEYQSLDADPDRRNAFLAHRRFITANIVNVSHAKLLDNWLCEVNAKKAQISIATRKSRKRSIEAKLIELGYTKGDFVDSWDDDNKWIQVFNRPFELNPKRWGTLQPKLEAIILTRRQGKRKRETSGFYTRYLANLSLTQDERLFVPSFEDMFKNTVVSEFCAGNNAHLAVTQDRWDAVLPTLEIYIEKQRLQKTAACLSALKSAHDILSANSSPVLGDVTPAISENSVDNDSILGYASSFFRCKECKCNAPIKGYPAILGDLHISGQAYCNNQWSISALACVHSRASNFSAITCDPLHLKIANAILLNVGLPLSTPMALVMSAGTVFQCIRCSPAFRKKMTWDEIVMHFEREELFYISAQNKITVVKDHDLDNPDPLVFFQDDETNPAVEFAPNTDPNMIDIMTSALYFCKLCHQADLCYEPKMNLEQVVMHIAIKHSLTPILDDVGICSV